MVDKKYGILGLFFLCSFSIVTYAKHSYQIEPTLRSPLNPRVTIITSVYKCDQFIEGFMQDIIEQTIFNECELLMIDANSPGDEEHVIRKYMELYPNITYIKLAKDPGLFGVWNLGIQIARSEYVTNANTDDRLACNCYELHAQALDRHADVDLVYSDFLYTFGANETMRCNTAHDRSDFPEFKPGHISNCLPNNHPMWRKSMHEKYGYFDARYLSVGDWEMWCRAVEGGALFKKVPGVLALFYRNPQGLSTNPAKKKLIKHEQKEVCERYSYFFYDKPHFKRDLLSSKQLGLKARERKEFLTSLKEWRKERATKRRQRRLK